MVELFRHFVDDQVLLDSMKHAVVKYAVSELQTIRPGSPLLSEESLSHLTAITGLDVSVIREVIDKPVRAAEGIMSAEAAICAWADGSLPGYLTIDKPTDTESIH